jgi:hypothetical protein
MAELYTFYLPAGSDTPTEQNPAGYQTRRTRPCGVSDPAELSLRGIRPRRTMAELYTFYSIHVLRGLIPTLQNNVLRGIKPRGTTFKNEYFCEFEKEFKNILGCEFGDFMGRIRGKNQR